MLSKYKHTFTNYFIEPTLNAYIHTKIITKN